MRAARSTPGKAPSATRGCREYRRRGAAWSAALAGLVFRLSDYIYGQFCIAQSGDDLRDRIPGRALVSTEIHGLCLPEPFLDLLAEQVDVGRLIVQKGVAVLVNSDHRKFLRCVARCLYLRDVNFETE